MLWNKVSDGKLVYSGATSVGRVRSDNQDCFGVFPAEGDSAADDHLFVVADGMGGHERGREASERTVDVVKETYFRGLQEDVSALLLEAFETANEDVYARSLEYGPTVTMGTTCTALSLRDGHGVIAHIGDSRAYRITRRSIKQLTHDHSYVEEMRRHGIISESEARTHPRRHALVRALGIEPTCSPDFVDVDYPKMGEWLLLCTDGLAHVDLGEIEDIVRGSPVQQASEELVDRANALGGFDNVTVVVVGVT